MLEVNMSKESGLSEFLGNRNLVESLNELKWLNEQDLYIDGASLAQEILILRRSLIRVLEEITGNRELPPIPAEVKSARIHRFLCDLKEATEIENENWEYQLQQNEFHRNTRTVNLDDEAEDFLELSNKKSEFVDPPKPPDGSGRIKVIFHVEPSPSLKDVFIQNNFTFEDNNAYGWSGDWLIKMADEVVLARGEVELPLRKGRFDPWR